eukprot:305931_1
MTNTAHRIFLSPNECPISSILLINHNTKTFDDTVNIKFKSIHAKNMEYNSENAQNLLHINGTIKSFKDLKVNDILEINYNLTLQINCISNTGGTNCNYTTE